MALEPTEITFDKPEWLITKFGNKISKKSVLCAPEKVSVKGKTIVEPRSVLRADMAKINIGQSCIVAEEVSPLLFSLSRRIWRTRVQSGCSSTLLAEVQGWPCRYSDDDWRLCRNRERNDY